MTIKITYLLDFYRTQYGGSEKQIGYLLSYLPRDLFAVQVISIQKSAFLRDEAIDAFPGVAFEWLDGKSDISKSPGALLRLYAALRRGRPDILHTFFPTSNKLGVLIGKMAGTKAIVSSRRDMGFNLDQSDIMQLRLANRFVSCVIANSEAVRDITIQKEGVARKKTAVVYNGIHLRPFKDRSAAGSNEEVIVGIVANLNRTVKRVDQFIKAAAILSKDHPGAQFWIVGEGNLRPDLERLAQDLGVGTSVRFLGKRNDVERLLQAMHIGVVCSDSEGLSNAIMEYMVAGLPVVATDAGGNPELVANGENGFLVPPGNYEALSRAIACLLDNPRLAEKMGRAGRSFIEHRFSIPAMLQDTISVYRRLMVAN